MAKQKILLVDDEESIRKTLRAFLISLGVSDVIEAGNGQEAIALVQTNPDIKFILMDLKMPVMDGLQTLEQIRKILPDVKVAILTGYPFYGEADQAVKKWGVVDFIVKPVDLDYLERIISAVLSL